MNQATITETDGIVPRRASIPTTLLVVDHEETTRELCATVAAQVGLRTSAAPCAEEALEILEQSAVDILLLDLRLPGMSGLELPKRVAGLYPHVSVMVLTHYGTIDSSIEATRIGARDYVTKPFRIEELRTGLERAIQAADLQLENRVLQFHSSSKRMIVILSRSEESLLDRSEAINGLKLACGGADSTIGATNRSYDRNSTDSL